MIPLSSLIAMLERAREVPCVDPAVRYLRGRVRRIPRRLRDAAHGVPMGHPAHPLLVQLPTGAWLSAAVLDGVGREREARLLIAVGLAGAAPAMLSGAVDWSALRPGQARTGLVHAAANAAAVGMYGASLTARFAGRPGRGRLLALGGLAAVGAGGWLGGHLAYRDAAGANHAEAVPHLVAAEWHDLGPLADLPVGRVHRRTIGEVPVLITDTTDGIAVLAERCSHLAGPLSDGEVADDCITCPWHGSTFRLRDGRPVAGPATAPQPVFETRVRDGRLEARLAGV